MLPQDIEAIIGKVMLIVFATFALCYARVNATELNSFSNKVIELISFEQNR